MNQNYMDNIKLLKLKLLCCTSATVFFTIFFTMWLSHQTLTPSLKLLTATLIIAASYLIATKLLTSEGSQANNTLHQLVDCLASLDKNGCYIDVSTKYAAMFGLEASEMIGQKWSLIIYPPDLINLGDLTDLNLEKKKFAISSRGLNSSGEFIYFDLTITAQMNDEGEALSYHCFAVDNFERLKTWRDLALHQEELKLIFDNVPMRIWYKDDQNGIVRLNKHAAESMGGTVEAFEGKNLYELCPETAKKTHVDDLDIIDTAMPRFNNVEKIRRENGSYTWISTDKVPYRDPTSGKSFVFVCAQDITNVVEVEEARSRLIDRLSHTNSELEEFAYIASHDLKAPLRGISQLASWLKDDCLALLPKESIRHLDLMQQRVHRMAALLDDLLSYSKVDRLEDQLELLDLNQLCRQFYDSWIQPFGFQFHFDVPIEPILIARKPLEIVLRNLLDNAIKHHHGKGNISLRYQYLNDQHVISVADDGPGIKAEMQEQVFKLFQTLKPRDQVEGSGMGLAVVKKIVTRYEGEIHLISDGTNGTEFIIHWPCSYTRNDYARAAS